MSDLTDFLLARIAEDEAAWGPVCLGPRRSGKTHARRHMAECEAKRAIVALHAQCGTGHGYCDDGGHGWGGDEGLGCADLAYMATPYADHADYRDEWRP